MKRAWGQKHASRYRLCVKRKRVRRLRSRCRLFVKRKLDRKIGSRCRRRRRRTLSSHCRFRLWRRSREWDCLCFSVVSIYENEIIHLARVLFGRASTHYRINSQTELDLLSPFAPPSLFLSEATTISPLSPPTLPPHKHVIVTSTRSSLGLEFGDFIPFPSAGQR